MNPLKDPEFEEMFEGAFAEIPDRDELNQQFEEMDDDVSFDLAEP